MEINFIKHKKIIFFVAIFILALVIFYEINMHYVFINGHIYNCKITSLNLNHKVLCENDVKNIARLQELEELDIFEATITDISFLSKLEKLRFLSIGGRTNCDIIDWSPLGECSQLEYLRLWDADFSNLTYIKKLDNLRTLDMSFGNNLNNIDDIVYLSNLKEVYLNSNNLSDITPICQLKNIEKIVICSTIVEIPDLSVCTQLKYLVLLVDANQYKHIKNISGLANSSIEELVLNAKPDEHSSLWEMPNLSKLTISNGVLTAEEIESLRVIGVTVVIE